MTHDGGGEISIFLFITMISMKESISTLVSMPMVFNKETKAVEGAFGYAYLKMSETALPSTF